MTRDIGPKAWETENDYEAECPTRDDLGVFPQKSVEINAWGGSEAERWWARMCVTGFSIKGVGRWPPAHFFL